MIRAVLALVALLLAVPNLAQQSTNYKLNEHTFNAGGHPADGVVLVSATYRVTLDAIGDGVVARGLSSGSFNLDTSFTVAYAPPGEVNGLAFTSPQILIWEPAGSGGDYNLYRGQVSGLGGLGYGNCLQPGIPTETALDGAPVPVGNGYFYLVTAENRIQEEGTKGMDSAGTQRPNPSPCP